MKTSLSRFGFLLCYRSASLPSLTLNSSRILRSAMTLRRPRPFLRTRHVSINAAHPGCKEGFVRRRSATVLCVDDEPNILTLRSAILAMAGYEVHVAKNGEIGFGKFRSAPGCFVVFHFQD